MDGVKPAPWWTSEFEGPLLHDATHYMDLLDYFAGPVDWLWSLASSANVPGPSKTCLRFYEVQKRRQRAFELSELTEYTDHAFELRGEKGILRIQGECVQLLQSRLALPNPTAASSGVGYRNSPSIIRPLSLPT